MHICVVSGIFHPETGGPATYLMHLLPALAERGHTVEVVTYTDSPHSFCDTTSYGYPVWRTSRRYPIPIRLLLLTLRIWQRARRADLIFVSDYGFPAAIANLLLRKPMLIKVVSDFAWEFSSRHNWISQKTTVMAFQQQAHPLRVRLLRWIQATYVRRASRAITPSQHVARLVIGWGMPAGRVQVVYNAIRQTLFDNLPARRVLRAELGWDDTPVIVTVARLAPVKGVDLLLRAVAKLHARRVVRVVVVGDGPSRADLEAEARSLGIAEIVTFTGQQPGEQVARYLRAADVFVLASRTEGLPHVVLEAMLAHTPVIATQVGGTPEVVADGETGWLVPPEDPAALADKIIECLDHPEQAARLAERASQQAGHFSWARLIADMDSLLQQFAGEDT